MIEDDLLRASGEGDRQAFGDLYMRMRTGLLAYAGVILGGDTAAAEDAVDEAFTDIWQRSGTIGHITNATAWIRRIVRNKSIDLLRKTSARETGSPSAFFEALEDTRPDPEADLASSDERRWLRGCLAVLNTDQREVVMLCYFEGLSLVQIAEATGVCESTVKTRLFYARRKLRERISASGLGSDIWRDHRNGCQSINGSGGLLQR